MYQIYTSLFRCFLFFFTHNTMFFSTNNPTKKKVSKFFHFTFFCKVSIKEKQICLPKLFQFSNVRKRWKLSEEVNFLTYRNIISVESFIRFECILTYPEIFSTNLIQYIQRLTFSLSKSKLKLWTDIILVPLYFGPKLTLIKFTVNNDKYTNTYKNLKRFLSVLE